MTLKDPVTLQLFRPTEAEICCMQMTYFDITKHLMQVVWSTAQGQMVQNVLIHQLNVRITQTYGSIGVPVLCKFKLLVSQSDQFKTFQNELT